MFLSVVIFLNFFFDFKSKYFKVDVFFLYPKFNRFYYFMCFSCKLLVKFAFKKITQIDNNSLFHFS